MELFPLLGLLPRGPLHLMELLMSTLLVGRDQTHLTQPWVSARTIQVDTSAAGIVEFGLGQRAMDELNANGRSAMERFLADWDFDAYRKRFRS